MAKRGGISIKENCCRPESFTKPTTITVVSDEINMVKRSRGKRKAREVKYMVVYRFSMGPVVDLVVLMEVRQW